MQEQNGAYSVRERRKFPRVDVNCEVKFRPVDLEDGVRDLGDQTPGVLNNISGGGVCFVAPDRQSEGQMLALELSLPGFPRDVISYGRVCWSVARADGRFDVGVEFWWIGWNDDEAQRQVRDFIKHALSDNDDKKPSS